MSDEFSKRLESAINRGKQAAEKKANEERQAEKHKSRLRESHARLRMQMCDYIESTMNRLADHIPGFRSEAVYDEDGWGSACYRERIHLEGGRRQTQFSRFEVVIRPCTDLLVLDLQCKAMINNRERFARSHHADLDGIELDEFRRCVESWSLQFAEACAAEG